MGLSLTQSCDRCLTSRTVTSSASSALEKDGWRKVALDVNFGPMRSEQPTLCPDCQRALKAEIAAHADKLRPIPLVSPTIEPPGIT